MQVRRVEAHGDLVEVIGAGTRGKVNVWKVIGATSGGQVSAKEGCKRGVGKERA